MSLCLADCSGSVMTLQRMWQRGIWGCCLWWFQQSSQSVFIAARVPITIRNRLQIFYSTFQDVSGLFGKLFVFSYVFNHIQVYPCISTHIQSISRCTIRGEGIKATVCESWPPVHVHFPHPILPLVCCPLWKDFEVRGFCWQWRRRRPRRRQQGKSLPKQEPPKSRRA